MRRKIDKNRFLFLVFVFFSFSILGVSDCWPQDLQFHFLTPDVQHFAIDNKIFDRLSEDHKQIQEPARILMYLDSISFADVISIERARIIQERNLYAGCGLGSGHRAGVGPR